MPLWLKSLTFLGVAGQVSNLELPHQESMDSPGCISFVSCASKVLVGQLFYWVSSICSPLSGLFWLLAKDIQKKTNT